MNTLLFAMLTFFFTSSSFAADDGMLCHESGAKKDASDVHLSLYDLDMARLQFVGLEPNRYFLAEGGGVYVQIATKKNTVTAAQAMIDRDSKLTIEFAEGGTSFVWKTPKFLKSYKCNLDKRH